MMHVETSSEAQSEDVGTQLQLRPNSQSRKRPRLKEFEYTGRYAYHIVLLPKNRVPVFNDHSWARHCATELEAIAAATNFGVLAYCFMPDHLHALVEDLEDNAQLLRFVQRFKQKTAFKFKQRFGGQLWQQSFYDHGIRRPEDVNSVAQYIFWNPVEAGLVRRPREFELSGGRYFDALADDTDGAKAASLRILKSFPELASLISRPNTNGTKVAASEEAEKEHIRTQL
jgi:putative transposase